MTRDRDYDTTIARMAGNIAAALVSTMGAAPSDAIARAAVDLARLIVARVKATEPPRGDA